MKRLVLGDIHGRFNFVKEIYNKEQPDEVIVLGDYFDSFKLNSDIILDSFKSLLQLKEEHEKTKGRFILLLGNHDLHYIHRIHVLGEVYSGYNRYYAGNAGRLIEPAYNEGKVQNVYIDYQNKYIYSHAGVTNTWLKNNDNECRLSQINHFKPERFTFNTDDPNDYYGTNIKQGPLWVRPGALTKDSYKDENNVIWSQVVGHTVMSKLTNYTLDGCNIFFCDTLPFAYLVQELDDDHNIINNEIKQHKEYNPNYRQ